MTNVQTTKMCAMNVRMVQTHVQLVQMINVMSAQPT